MLGLSEGGNLLGFARVWLVTSNAGDVTGVDKMSVGASTSWAESVVYVVLILALFGSCVVCNRDAQGPMVQINYCDATEGETE